MCLGLLYYPGNLLLKKYSKFKELQTSETNSLLKNFRVRPDTFFTNNAYELTVKSFAEKDIKNIQLDLNAPEVTLLAPITPSSDSSESTSTTNSAIAETLSTEQPTATAVTTAKEEMKIVEVKTKEPEKKVIIQATPIQDKKVDNLKYYIQLGVFKSLDNANNLLKSVGPGFLIVKSTVNSDQYIVRSNPGSREDIEKLVEIAKKKESSITPIIRIW